MTAHAHRSPTILSSVPAIRPLPSVVRPPTSVVCLLTSVVCLLSSAPARADAGLDALVAAYPEHLAGYDEDFLIWKDGTKMPLGDKASTLSFSERVKNPTIRDQVSIPYPPGRPSREPALNEDPGRLRNEAFFRKMYGNCRAKEVEGRLKAIDWLPSRKGGGRVKVTTVNGVAEKLAAVAKDLEALPADMTQYLVPSAGTFNCRVVADTTSLSPHSYGIAIDLATKFGDYWLWSRGKSNGKEEPPIPYKNRFPYEIAEVFERHGFVWGGRWYHYDTFHFEYRPELIPASRRVGGGG